MQRRSPMSETLEPRKVEKPFLGRWVITTLVLLVRSPVSFGAAVALLAISGLLGTDIVPARLIDVGWTLIVGSLLLCRRDFPKFSPPRSVSILRFVLGASPIEGVHHGSNGSNLPHA